MPYKIRKLPNQEKWEVYNTKTKHKFAKHSEKKKAEKQLTLLKNFEKARMKKSKSKNKK